MREKYTLSDEEFGIVVGMLQRAGTALISEVKAALEIHGDRARELLRVVCLEPAREWVGPAFRFRYTLAPDYADRIQERKARQQDRLGRLHGYVDPAARATPDVWPSGDPRDFDTDGMGRIRYAGPVKRDPRYDLEDAA